MKLFLSFVLVLAGASLFYACKDKSTGPEEPEGWTCNTTITVSLGSQTPTDVTGTGTAERLRDAKSAAMKNACSNAIDIHPVASVSSESLKHTYRGMCESGTLTGVRKTKEDCKGSGNLQDLIDLLD